MLDIRLHFDPCELHLTRLSYMLTSVSLQEYFDSLILQIASHNKVLISVLTDTSFT